jgi:hypothetical protein
MVLQRAHQFCRARDPCRVCDHLLALAPAASGRRCSLPSSRPSSRPNRKRPAGRGTSTSQLSASAKRSGGNLLAPDFVAAPVIADAVHHAQAPPFRPSRRGATIVSALVGACTAIDPQMRRNRQFLLIGKLHQFAGVDAQRSGDAVEPVERQCARSGFQPSDGLRGGWRDAAFGNVEQGQALGLRGLRGCGCSMAFDLSIKPNRFFYFPT